MRRYPHLSPPLVLILCVLGIAGCTAPVTERVISAPGASAASRGDNYLIAPNDALTITVFQEPDMTTQQQVSRDGTISFPLVGRVKVGGLTLGQAEKAISDRLSEKYLVNPQVSIVITQYSTQSYTILGQVGAPGAYPIPYEEVAFTLPMAIARSGGNTRIGNLRNIRINRWENGTLKQYTVNMHNPAGQRFVIRPGDLVFVQETLF